MKSTIGRNDRRRWLLGLALTLAVVGAPVGVMADLVVDGGATYTVTEDIIHDNEIIGQNSTGTLIQGGFTNTVNLDLKLGQNAGSSGIYTLSAGALSTYHNHVGFSGTGTFTQSGGTHETDILELGSNPESSGVYNLSGGSFSVKSELVGSAGTGTFTQSGGTHTVTEGLGVAFGTDTIGVYNLNAGDLSAPITIIGGGGTGTFTQSGGTYTVTDDLYLAYQPSSKGFYNLSGGSLSAKNERIGYLDTGTFT